MLLYFKRILPGLRNQYVDHIRKIKTTHKKAESEYIKEYGNEILKGHTSLYIRISFSFKPQTTSKNVR